MEKFIYKIILIIFFGSCASSNLKLRTNKPDAQLSVVLPSGEQKVLGVGQIDKTFKELELSGPFTVIAEKEGFEKQAVFVPKPYLGAEVIVNFNLVNRENGKSMESQSSQTNQKINDTFVKGLAHTYSYVQQKEYGLAHSKLQELLVNYPDFASLWGLQGNIYYLQRRYDMAYESYNKAVDLDSSSLEFKNMLEKVKSLKGGG